MLYAGSAVFARKHHTSGVEIYTSYLNSKCHIVSTAIGYNKLYINVTNKPRRSKLVFNKRWQWKFIVANVKWLYTIIKYNSSNRNKQY
jgi:hypothetical protein